MNTYPIYLAGTFISTSEKLDVVNPYTGKVFATTFRAGETEINRAIERAHTVKEELKQLPAHKKQSILLQIADGLRQEKNYLAAVLAEESAKPKRYALAEIERSIQTFRVAAEECKRLPKEYLSLDWTPAGERREGLVKHFPIGVVSGIAPFNFPMNLAVHKIAPAIAAGCPIILKPASATPLSTLELAEIIDETELPKGALSVLPCNRSVGNQLVSDPRLQLLSFTGSPEIGWKMKEQCGRKKTILELGGNAGVIVSNSCEVRAIVKKCVYGAFAYSGQICIHAQRFFVHEAVWDSFLSDFLEESRKLKYGDPLEEETDISVMIDEDNAKRVELWINEALRAGAQLLMGGKRSGAYIEPTVLTNTTVAMKVNAEEVFGPVVCIEKVKNINEAIDCVNKSRYGLQCGVFTNSVKEMDKCFTQLEVGGVILNDVPTFRIDHMPYGGVKDSGLGREGVKYAIQDMLEPRILVK